MYPQGAKILAVFKSIMAFTNSITSARHTIHALTESTKGLLVERENTFIRTQIHVPNSFQLVAEIHVATMLPMGSM
jgi:hypothetical protein